MGKLIDSLNQEQRIWYTEMLIMAILADKTVKQTEITYLKEVVGCIDDDGERKRLIQEIKAGKSSILRPLDGVPKQILADIFSHLIESCISDLDFAEEEKELLRKIGFLFDFRKGYIKRWLDWGIVGLELKQYQQTIVKSRINNREFIGPVHLLNTEQKKWYIDVMVSALMIAGIKDEKEVNLLSFMLESAGNKEEQKILKIHVFNKHRPPMKRAPKLDEEILILIFMDILSIHTADGQLSYKGEQQIKQLSDLSRISTIAYTQIMEWCNRGLHWKKARQVLLGNVELNASAEDQEAVSKGLLIPHPDNNSIKIRELECFICDEKTKVKFFQLKHYSQVLDHNIFGVTRYLKANEGFDFIDYNRIRIIMCPVCYFSSTDKDLFCKGEKHKTPEILSDPQFRQKWIEKASSREESLQDLMGEMQSINRSLEAVTASFQIAIETANALGRKSDDDDWLGKEINLRLQLSEILMYNRDEDGAEEELTKLKDSCKKIFLTSPNDVLVLKCARILLLTALYFNDEQGMNTYYDFFRDFKAEKLSLLKYDTKDYFNKLFAEIKLIWDKRELYKKSELTGFHLPSLKKKKDTETEAETETEQK